MFANTPWHPTIAVFRAASAAVVLIGIALVFRQPDLLVLAAPFAVVSGWSVLTRPTEAPTVTDQIGHPTLREGDATRWAVSVSDASNVDIVSATVDDHTWFERVPHRGAATALVTDDAGGVDFGLRSRRWGTYLLEPLRVTAVSPWAAFRHTVKQLPQTVTSLPRPGVFDSSTPVRPTDGLVGVNRAARPGEGSEFAGLRDFQVGDRMRRINWNRSLRSSTLQVNATFADQDTHIAVVVDSSTDVGDSGGVDGVASSMDTTVRAAGAIAEHYGQHGGRVSLQSLDHSARLSVAPGSGTAHVRRILDTLAQASVQSGRYAGWGLHRPASSADITIVLSPLLTTRALDRAVDLGRAGRPVVVIDTLPDDVGESDDPLAELAWRIRLLERRRELRIVQEYGVAVVAWQGSGSLDHFLREAVRRAAAPKVRA